MAAYARIAIPPSQLSSAATIPFIPASTVVSPPNKDPTTALTILPVSNSDRRNRYYRSPVSFDTGKSADVKNILVTGSSRISFDSVTPVDRDSVAMKPDQQRMVVASADRSNAGSAVTCDTPPGDLAGQTIVVVGLGASGRAAARLALARGAAAVIGLDRRTDAKALEDDPSIWDGLPEPTSAPSLASRLSTHLGPHPLPLLLSAALVVLSPGVPVSEPTIAQAISQGVPMLSELAFAYDCLPAGLPIAAVTGTNGKSTVATFAGQILESIGIHTFVGGNLGTPLSLAALDFVTSQHGRAGSSKPIQAAVVEVSSYQMELPGRFRPKAAVILNLTPDHLERHGSMASYGAAKCRLFARMEEPDIAVIPSDDPLLERLAGEAGGHPSMAWLGRLPGCCVDHAERSALLQLPCSRSDASSGDAGGCAFPAPLTLDLSPLGAVGRHNAENAAVAALLCLALGLEGSGVSLEGVQSAVKVLRPPPHRMELVVVDDQDRSWINDSKATNVEASTAGIQGLGEESMAVILLGGIAKVLKSLDAGDGGSASPLGFSKLVSVLNRHRAVITFGQSGPAIASELTASGLSAPLIQCETMEQAMHAASDTALPDDTILLSPACASFDEFDNFEHRGHVFADIAQKLSQV